MQILKTYFLDSLFNIFLFLFRKKAETSKIYSPVPLNLLLIQFGTIQQTLSITPLITVLSKKLNCTITVLCNKHNLPVFNNNQYIHNSLILDSDQFGSLKTLRKLYKNKYHVLIDTHELINRDEGLHSDFAVYLHQNHIMNKVPKERITEILVDALNIEREFIRQ